MFTYLSGSDDFNWANNYHTVKDFMIFCIVEMNGSITVMIIVD